MHKTLKNVLIKIGCKTTAYLNIKGNYRVSIENLNDSYLKKQINRIDSNSRGLNDLGSEEDSEN